MKDQPIRKLKIYVSPFRNQAYLVAYDTQLRKVIEMRTIPSYKHLDHYIKSLSKKYADSYRIIYK